MSQDTVGILLNSSMYRGIPTRRTGQEWIAGYEETAREFGLTPYFCASGHRSGGGQLRGVCI
ncbi:hypothetical protein HMSSN139_63480 [Paenibacillus sp. HMSSN-139]|nr:hypothetical protein HMSSN139_63480 [Paenibacillus sp. HMSSN-139]